MSGMTNAWPAECVEIFDLCAMEKFAEARELYRILTPSFHLDATFRVEAGKITSINLAQR